MVLWRAIVVLLLLALPASAQQTSPTVLIIDGDRLFSDTLYGRRLSRELEVQALAWQAENDRIAQSLKDEERSLTLRRATMEPEAFRREAEAFDAKVQESRRVGDAKTQELQAAISEIRKRFEQQVLSIINDVMVERGAMLVLEQDTVILSARAANITDDVIVRVDAVLGDGSRIPGR